MIARQRFDDLLIRFQDHLIQVSKAVSRLEKWDQEKAYKTGVEHAYRKVCKDLLAFRNSVLVSDKSESKI